MVIWDGGWTLTMTWDHLNTNKQTIRQILSVYLQNRKICAKFVKHRLWDAGRNGDTSFRLSHTDSGDAQKKRRITSFQDFMQTSQHNPSFLSCVLSFLRWKLPSKTEVSRRDGRTECCSSRGLCWLYRPFLKNSTNVFK
jgi:hypothetical protein